MILEIRALNFVFGLQCFQVRDDLIFVLLDLVLGIEVAFDFWKGLFRFWLNNDGSLDNVNLLVFLLNVCRYLFFALLCLLIGLRLILNWFGKSVLVSGLYHEIFGL
jgi:hypothetical protein